MPNQPQAAQAPHQSKISPFKDEAAFENELKDFANKYRIRLSEHSRRISDYFEMSCFNMIVRYYEHHGFTASVENLQAGRFRFKCSPSGLLENFSYMKLSNGISDYHIYHNASVQSAHDTDVFTTPDIVVATDFPIQISNDYYKTKKRFSYLPNNEVVTFCEAKHHTPLPELIINFIGTVNELKPHCLQDKTDYEVNTPHLAPSLMMSGSLSKPTDKVARSLERRYFVNVIGDLFVEPYKTTFSIIGVGYLATMGQKRRFEEEAIIATTPS